MDKPIPEAVCKWPGYPNFPNKAHQRAYRDGIAAAESGKRRFAPYDGGNRSSGYFRKAWLAGYDGAISAVAQQPAAVDGADR